MSERPQERRPTDAELEILNVLWDRGPSTVREVLAAITMRREAGYTTVLKLMQIMTDKSLVKRDESVRPQVYSATVTRRRTQKQMLGHLLDRLFAGSSGSLVVEALSAGDTTAEERDRIRELLDRLEEGKS